MEINFIFTFNCQNIKKFVAPNQSISSSLYKIVLEEESLNNIKIKILLCGGNQVDLEKTFKENKLKDGETIMVVSELKGNLNTTLEESPFRFEVKKCITNHSHVNLENSDLSAFIDKTFDVFKSLKNEYLLIYSYSENYIDYSLFSYDILKDKIVNKKLNSHKERIFTVSHFLDINNNRDLLLTAAFDKKIKIWNINNNFQLIYKKKPDYYFRENTYLLSENILSYNNKIYLTTSAYEIKSEGYFIFYYSLLGDEVGMLNDSKDNTNFLNTYYNNNIPFIIAANCGNIKVYNFINKKLVKEFYDNDFSLNYLSAIIFEYKNKIAIISSSSDGFLRIWDYNSPKIILNKIESYSNNWIIGIEFINERFLLGACADGTLKEFDLNKGYLACSLDRNIKDSLLVVKYINIKGKIMYLLILLEDLLNYGNNE